MKEARRAGEGANGAAAPAGAAAGASAGVCPRTDHYAALAQALFLSVARPDQAPFCPAHNEPHGSLSLTIPAALSAADACSQRKADCSTNEAIACSYGTAVGVSDCAQSKAIAQPNSQSDVYALEPSHAGAEPEADAGDASTHGIAVGGPNGSQSATLALSHVRSNVAADGPSNPAERLADASADESDWAAYSHAIISTFGTALCCPHQV